MSRHILHRSLALAFAGALTASATPRAALAQTSAPDVNVDVAIDGAVTGGALALALAATLIPVDTDNRWDRELFGAVDDRVKDNFSASAAKLSDALVAVTIATPVLLQLDRGLDEAAGKRALLYGETLALALAANAVTKYAVRRPRPYNYSAEPRVAAYAAEAGKDAHLSFYSGHSTLSFAAAVSGSYLFALGSADNKVKAVVWGTELALAAATANLRVRAGKHFYSDVVIGGLVGAAIGFAVPALHADGGVYEPSGAEIGAMVGGVVVGAAAAQLLPLGNDILIPLPEATGSSGVVGLRLIPIAASDGAGMGVGGMF